MKAALEAAAKAKEACATLVGLGAASGEAAGACKTGGQFASAETQAGPEGSEADDQDDASEGSDTGEGTGDGDAKTKFGGIEFGVGLAFSHDVGETNRVGQAELVDGIVRVSASDNTKARLMLETHYFFTPTLRPEGGGRFNRVAEFLGMKNYPDEFDKYGNLVKRGVKNWGFGPFVAVQAGEGELIQAVGAGIMVGLRRPGEGSDSFNMGLGLLIDLNVRTLGEGIEENEPLPEGETTIRFKEQSQAGLMIMSSYSF